MSRREHNEQPLLLDMVVTDESEPLVPAVTDDSQLLEPAGGAATPQRAGRLDTSVADLMIVPRGNRRRRLLVSVAAGWLILVLVLAVAADLLPLRAYDEPLDVTRQRPGLRWPEFLGTDQIGRSILSRVIHGARVSLAVGVGAVTFGMIVGGGIGLVAGYFRGRIETILNILINSVLAFPPLVLLLAVAAVTTPSLRTLVATLTLLSIPTYARLALANTLTIRQREYILAATALGATHRRIVLREVLPNVVLTMLSFAFLVVAAIMVAEGGLSFLGLGIPPPTPSWGAMMAGGRPFLATDPHIAMVPSVVLLLTIFSLNVVGDHARRRFDPRSSAL